MLTDRLSARDVTESDILELIAIGHEELLELQYKSEPPDQTMLLKTACALANFGGGFLLIGIAEENSRAAAVVNIPDAKRVVPKSQADIASRTANGQLGYNARCDCERSDRKRRRVPDPKRGS